MLKDKLKPILALVLGVLFTRTAMTSDVFAHVQFRPPAIDMETVFRIGAGNFSLPHTETSFAPSPQPLPASEEPTEDVLAVGKWHLGELPAADVPVFDPTQMPPSPKASPPTENADNGVKAVTLLGTDENGKPASDGRVYLTNSSKLNVNLDALKKTPLGFTKTTKTKKSAPTVLIIHTHGSESYTPDAAHPYTPVDGIRSPDGKVNVLRLGDELAKIYEKAGIGVVHNRNLHDVPSYTASYNRALEDIEAEIKKHPSIQIVLDLHRDSIETGDGKQIKTVTAEGGTAQMMFVVGTNSSGLTHPNWKQNFAFAARLQTELLKGSPTLMRPIHLRAERFNQHATPGSLILETGTSGNSLDEALSAIRIFGNTSAAMIRQWTMDN